MFFRFFPDSSLMPMDREVPMLLRDPITMLLHLLMQLPMHVDLNYFTSMAQGIYNLVYVQILSGLSCGFQEVERECWKHKMSNYSSSENPNLFFFILGTVIRYLEKFPFYWSEKSGDMEQEDMTEQYQNFASEDKEYELELKAQSLLLPYLRVATLLRHQIYEQDLPLITSKDAEFSSLAQFLGLGVGNETAECVNMDLGEGGASVSTDLSPSKRKELRCHSFLSWISPTPLTTIWTWCEDIGSFIGRARVASMSLLQSHHKLWNQPTLMQLPHAYDIIFQYYHRKQCPNCNSIPKDPSICLVCGTMVCMRGKFQKYFYSSEITWFLFCGVLLLTLFLSNYLDSCCKPANGSCEAIDHSIVCGAGTVIYLSVNSSTIVAVRGRRAVCRQI